MKRDLLHLLCCGTLLFAGCTQDFDEPIPVVPTPEGAIAINISGAIDQTYSTRVDDGGFCDGDQIGLFGVNYTDNNSVAGELLDEGNQVDNARYTFDEANWQWVSSGNIYYKDAETNIDLYGYYPYANVENVNAYEFEVAQDQSGGNAVDGYAMSDFLWGKTENVTPSENKVKIKFNHKMACANVILAEGDGFESGEFERLEKGVLVMNTTRTSTIDLSTGEVTAVGDAPMEGIIMKSNAEGFRAIVVPQTVAAGISLFSITIDGISYRFKKDADFTYEAGKQSKFTITINKKEHSGEYEFILTDTEIVDWIADLDSHGGEARQYYVVHCEEAGTLEAKIAEAKKNPAKIKHIKVSGKIGAADFEFMRSKMDILQSVNLKECEIVQSWRWLVEFDNEGFHYEYFYCDRPDSHEEALVILEKRAEELGKTITGRYSHDNDELEVYNEIPTEAFRGKSTLVNFEFPAKTTKVGYNAFDGCSLLSGALIIPNSVTDIKNNAFSGCYSLTSLSLPLGLEKIGSSAFSSCSSLSGQLGLPSSVTYIGDGAFSGCNGFTGPLVLPSSLKELGGDAFRGCRGFTGDLVIPESITKISNNTFIGCSGLNGQLILHDGITEFAGDTSDYNSYYSGAFNGCSFQGELKLPKNIIKIPSGYFLGCQFSAIAGFPDGLLEIGARAFQYNGRLMGTLEFPESLVSLGVGAFSGCNTLEGIVLPSDLGTIREETFENCYYLNKIVCRSTEPPIVQGSAFNGVAKDNFAVEVPESAVNRYQNESGWNEFKRIVAHHDFTISRRLMRTLNAEHSRELVLRAPANYAWSIESCPDWVTVTPSSGVGKTEVTVTVAEMTAADVGSFEINIGNYNYPEYETNTGRAGEVVFLLNDKNYRATLKVEQYDYEHYDGEVIVNQTATKGGGVNLVFMGDCFDARDIAHGTYLSGIEEAIGYYFDIEPYKTYRDYFNVYTVFGMSNDSGMGTVDTIRDAKFGSQYTLNAGIGPNEDVCFEYAMKAETVNMDNINRSLVVLIENTTEYGGVTYMWADGSAIAICPMSDDAFPYDFRGLVQHEAGGHGFAKLGDEYIYHNAFISTCTYCIGAEKAVRDAHSLGWYRNLSLTGDMDEVAWSHLIFHSTYSNIVDIYEGGYMHTRGCFRSEPNSCMNNNIPYYSAISRQEIVERIKRYAGEEFDINDFYANDVLDTYGNKAATSSSEAMPTAITLTGAGKQMPPRFMGDKPQLKKNNK